MMRVRQRKDRAERTIDKGNRSWIRNRILRFLVAVVLSFSPYHRIRYVAFCDTAPIVDVLRMPFWDVQCPQILGVACHWAPLRINPRSGYMSSVRLGVREPTCHWWDIGFSRSRCLVWRNAITPRRKMSCLRPLKSPWSRKLSTARSAAGSLPTSTAIWSAIINIHFPKK